ncbi:hypothetical protein FOWG_11514 [Fusarium oxysporum f. sp. lycopersici MN25]|nr:hypothetical protein FOWG_11514 [Fusarium oxysporum f. sp. lycopersici MN25]
MGDAGLFQQRGRHKLTRRALKVTDSCQARLQAPATGTLHVIRFNTPFDSKFISFPSSPPSHNTAPQIIPHLTATQAEVLHSRKLTLEVLVCERAPVLRLPSMPPGQLSHRLCKSEQPNNTGLFSESEILGNPQPQLKLDTDSENCLGQLPDATSHLKQEGPSLAPPASPGHNKACVRRNNVEPSSDLSANEENCDVSHGGQNLSTVAPNSSLSQLIEGRDEHDSQASVPSERQSTSSSLLPSAEPRSALSVLLERLASMSDRLHCVVDENFDIDTIAWLVIGLGADESRQRLFNFLDEATMGVWYCLGDVVSQSFRFLIELESPEEACVSHGLSCKRVMVVQDELGCRQLRFKTVHRAQ